MRTIVALALHIPIISLLGAAILLILAIPGETALIRIRHGPQVTVPKLYAQAGTLAVLLPLMVLALVRMARAAGEVLRQRGEGRVHRTALAVGEVVLWQGGPGWRSFNAQRILLTLLGFLGPTVYAYWMWRIWAGADLLSYKLVDTFVATAVLAANIITVCVRGLPTLRIWLCDVFGVVAVTDQRIAWLTPWHGNVYREVRGADLVFAALIEGDDKRGWVAISENRRGHVKAIDLMGFPRPRLAVAAIETLMARWAVDSKTSKSGVGDSS